MQYLELSFFLLQMEKYSNEHADLCFYKSSLKGVVQDYVISFHEEEKVIEPIIGKTLMLVKQLFEKYKEHTIRARLIAKVNYHHLNDKQEVDDTRSYHFPSYQVEIVNDVEDFFTRHLMKIVSRMDSFNANGSNLLIDRIEHIHIALTEC